MFGQIVLLAEVVPLPLQVTTLDAERHRLFRFRPDEPHGFHSVRLVGQLLPHLVDVLAFTDDVFLGQFDDVGSVEPEVQPHQQGGAGDARGVGEGNTNLFDGVLHLVAFGDGQHVPLVPDPRHRVVVIGRQSVQEGVNPALVLRLASVVPSGVLLEQLQELPVVVDGDFRHQDVAARLHEQVDGGSLVGLVLADLAVDVLLGFLLHAALRRGFLDVVAVQHPHRQFVIVQPQHDEFLLCVRVHGRNVGVVDVPFGEVKDVLPLLDELGGVPALGLQTLNDDFQRPQPLLQVRPLPLLGIVGGGQDGEVLVPIRAAGDLPFGDGFPQDVGQLLRRLADAQLLEFPAVLATIPRPASFFTHVVHHTSPKARCQVH